MLQSSSSLLMVRNFQKEIVMSSVAPLRSADGAMWCSAQHGEAQLTYLDSNTLNANRVGDGRGQGESVELWSLKE